MTSVSPRHAQHTDALTANQLTIDTLGRCLLPSPVARHLGERSMQFVGSADKVLLDDSLSGLIQATGSGATEPGTLPAFELAGPRDRIYFDPRTLRCGIVTCGGLAPGLNNVVRGLVLELWNAYGVRHIVGFRYGYEGLISRLGHPPMSLTPDEVGPIHHEGGTVLGTSRGSQNAAEMVDNLEANGIGVLFVIGGDGTMNGAMQVCDEIARRQLRIAVIGIPKTIDNDVDLLDRSFGFQTSVEAAQAAILSAYTEAKCNMPNGIGIVKLMGRSSGFIAAHSVMASGDVDLCLVPEVQIELDGPNGCLPFLLDRVKDKGFAVVVVAEGAGEELLGESAEVDAGGNRKLPAIGVGV